MLVGSLWDLVRHGWYLDKQELRIMKHLKQYEGMEAIPNPITCKNCGKELKQDRYGLWVHIHNSDTRCALVWEDDPRLKR